MILIILLVLHQTLEQIAGFRNTFDRAGVKPCPYSCITTRGRALRPLAPGVPLRPYLVAVFAYVTCVTRTYHALIGCFIRVLTLLAVTVDTYNSGTRVFLLEAIVLSIHGVVFVSFITLAAVHVWANHRQTLPGRARLLAWTKYLLSWTTS